MTGKILSVACAEMVAGAALCLSTGAQAGAIVFSEDFSQAVPDPGAQPYGLGVIPHTAFTVTAGNVDILGALNDGGVSFTCTGNPSGNCLDLIGSGQNGTIQTTNPISLTVGHTYTISFNDVLQGPFSSSDTATFDVSLANGSFLGVTANITVQTPNLTFVDNSASGLLTFESLTGGDNTHGAVISNITVTDDSISVVPGPIAGSGLPGLILAGGGLLAWWRRKRKAEAGA